MVTMRNNLLFSVQKDIEIYSNTLNDKNYGEIVLKHVRPLCMHALCKIYFCFVIFFFILSKKWREEVNVFFNMKTSNTLLMVSSIINFQQNYMLWNHINSEIVLYFFFFRNWNKSQVYIIIKLNHKNVAVFIFFFQKARFTPLFITFAGFGRC